MIRWNEVTALFGGTFDPPHIGHRAAVIGLFENPGVRAVRVIPSPTPPHKPAMASAQDRVEMTRLAFTPSPDFRPRGPVILDLCEIQRAQAHPGALTYSFDTLQQIRRELPKIAFVIGTDQLEKLSTWHRFPEVLGLCHWIVLERKGSATTAWRAVLAEWQSSGLIQHDSGSWRVRQGDTTIQPVVTSAPALSSTQIREIIAKNGTPPESQIPSEVHNYLMKHRLYGTKRPLE